MNAPARQLLWVLPEGQRKMEMEKDTKIPNAANFIIHKEDHTIGNLLRMYVHQRGALPPRSAPPRTRASPMRIAPVHCRALPN